MCFPSLSSSRPISFMPFQPTFLGGWGAVFPATLFTALHAPPQGTAAVTCWQEGSWQRAVRLEAGFLYQLIVVLSCWEALALSVSHTSAHLFLPWVSAVFCKKPKHLLSEHRSLGGSWQRWSSWTDIFIFFLISGKHDPFSPKAPDVMPYLLSFLPPLTTASLPVLHFNCWRGSSLSVLGKLTSALSSLHERGSSQPLVTSCLPEVPAQYQPMSLPEVC